MCQALTSVPCRSVPSGSPGAACMGLSLTHLSPCAHWVWPMGSQIWLEMQEQEERGWKVPGAPPCLKTAIRAWASPSPWPGSGASFPQSPTPGASTFLAVLLLLSFFPTPAECTSRSRTGTQHIPTTWAGLLPWAAPKLGLQDFSAKQAAVTEQPFLTPGPGWVIWERTQDCNKSRAVK